LREEELRDKNDELREEIFETYEKMLRTDHWKAEDLKESARAMTRRIDELTEKNRKLSEAIALIKKKMEEDGAE